MVVEELEELLEPSPTALAALPNAFFNMLNAPFGAFVEFILSIPYSQNKRNTTLAQHGIKSSYDSYVSSSAFVF